MGIDSTMTAGMVAAARAVYALKGYSVLPQDDGAMGGVDFWVVAPNCDIRIGVRVRAADMIFKDEVSDTINQLNDGEFLHFITDGKFSSDVASLNADGKVVTLIDGDRARKTFAEFPALMARLGLIEPPHAVPAAPVTTPVPVEKKSLPLVFTVAGISVAVLLIFGLVTAAIAIPNIERFNEAAIEARDRRNAQNFASVFSAAKVAGVDFAAGNDDLMATLSAIKEGATINRNAPSGGSYFGIPQIPLEDMAEAANYLALQDGHLHYVPDEISRKNLLTLKEVKKRGIQKKSDQPQGSRKAMVAVEAKKEASEIVRFMEEAKYRRSTDYMKIAGNDKDVAIQLLMSTIRNFLVRTDPHEIPEFDRRYSEESEILYFAKQFLKVEDGNLVISDDNSAYEKAFDAYVMNDRKVPD